MFNKLSNHVRVQLLLALITINAQANIAYATSVDELVNTQQLTLTVQIKDPDNIIAKQPVILQLQIATNRWFASGNSVGPINVQDIVVLTDSELVINGNERINGQTWVTQLREITFYPMQPGIYTLPPIAVNIAVNQASGDNAVGTIYTKPLTLTVDLPEALLNIENYVVSSNFTVEIDGGLEQVTDAQIGEAITQTITFSGTNVPAMMLPQVVIEQLPGISIYQKPAVLEDKSNRGELIGKRKQSLTYFFEKAGEYTLKEQRFYWWNIDDKQLGTVTLPQITWTVNAGSFPILSKLKNLQLSDVNFNSFTSLVMLLALLIALITFIIVIIRNRSAIINLYKVLTKQSYRQQKQLFLAALTAKKYNLACQQLYKIIDLDTHDSSTLEQYFSTSKEKQQLIKQLVLLAYKDSTMSRENIAPFTAQQGKRLLSSIKINKTLKSVNVDDYIRLN